MQPAEPRGRWIEMKISFRISAILLLSSCADFAQSPSAPHPAKHPAPPKTFHLYIGTFTTPTAPNGHPDGAPPSKGIYLSHFNAQSGTLSAPSLAAEVANSSFLALSPNQRFLYAISETNPEAFVSAYAINPHTGQLRLLNRLPTGGEGTAFVSLDKTGKNVLLANYGSSSVTVIQTNADGSLGKLTSFIQYALPVPPGSAAAPAPTPPSINDPAPHTHCTVISPDNRFVVVLNMGLDQLYTYRFNAETGVLALPATVTNLPSGEGPRHFVFSPDGRFGYLISQNTGNVTAFSWDQATGTLQNLQTSATFPAGLDAFNLSSEIALTPNGKFLYEANRRSRGPKNQLGPDDIVAFKVNQQTGTLAHVQTTDLGASIPRCFSIDPTGAYMILAGEQSNQVAVYTINQQDGKLSPTANSIYIHFPACMALVASQ